MLINLTYKGNPNDEMMHCMIGKGIIFDTGGYHLKPYGYYFLLFNYIWNTFYLKFLILIF